MKQKNKNKVAVVAYVDERYTKHLDEIKNNKLIQIDLNKENPMDKLNGIEKKDIKIFWLSPGSQHGKFYKELKAAINKIYKRKEL
jgi:hypothetical protein